MSLADFPFITFQNSPFALYTLEERLPALLQEIIDSQSFSSAINANLTQFKASLKDHIVKVPQLSYEEKPYWENFLESYEGRVLPQLPFFPAEIYFYRHMLDITRFSDNQIDPFGFKKEEELMSQYRAIDQLVEVSENANMDESIHLALAGNKADLSLLHRNRDGLELIVDDTAQLIQALENAFTVHIILDNAGVELLSDLLLSRNILRSGKIEKVMLYPKVLPLFVSDALSADIEHTLQFLEASDNSALHSFARDIRELLEVGKLILHKYIGWNTPQHFTALQNKLKTLIPANDLLISKGDANYRRFFEDRLLPVEFQGGVHITKFQFALRTLKSEIITDISPEIASRCSRENPDWMSCGKYAVVQRLI